MMDRIRGVLRDGPATTGEISRELDYPIHNTAAMLDQEYRRGKVKRQRFPTGDKRVRNLWSIAE